MFNWHIPFTTIVCSFLFALICLPDHAWAQQEANYDEGRVPQYTLPNLLRSTDGNPITNAEDWKAQRYVWMNLLREEMYGEFPGDELQVKFILQSSDLVFENSARRKQVVMNVSNGLDEVDIDVLLYLPTTSAAPVPLFMGLNFYGNHTIHPDEGITIPRSWSRNNEAFGITNNRPTAASRGLRASRWPVDTMLAAGFGLATMYYGDIDPDYDDDFENGIHGLLADQVDKANLSSISAWAWALSKLMDLMEQDHMIDHEKIALIGHSRLGKTSLWAGAEDERFAIVISNNSGCGGAALSRRQFGETVNRINHSFPHWFNNRFNAYNNLEHELPFDQHTLLAAIAPRPLYVASALDDQWADPKGEFLALRAAGTVYDMLGLPSLSNQTMPEPDQPVSTSCNGYHLRSGKHDLTLYDWKQYIEFAKNHYANSEK